MPHLIVGNNQKAMLSCAKEFPRADKLQKMCSIQGRLGIRPEKELFADYPSACNGANAEIL